MKSNLHFFIKQNGNNFYFFPSHTFKFITKFNNFQTEVNQSNFYLKKIE